MELLSFDRKSGGVSFRTFHHPNLLLKMKENPLPSQFLEEKYFRNKKLPEIGVSQRVFTMECGLYVLN